MTTGRGFAAAAGLLVLGFWWSQEPAAQTPASSSAPSEPGLSAVQAGDLANGRAVVVGAATAGGGIQPQPCLTCHGIDGVGDGTGAFPRISGQPAFYLYKQLLDYASGARENAIMSPIARAMTETDMRDVAVYYASRRDAAYFPPPPVDPLALQRGGAINAAGSAETGVQACVNCHGPAGTGIGPSFPYLAGQYAQYTILQFQLWKQDQRRNDPLAVMKDIAERMDAADIEAVALYFESVRPPGASPLTRTPMRSR